MLHTRKHVLQIEACGFAFLTNYLILRVAGKDTNFSDTMHYYFPKCGWAVSMACFIVNFYVGIILFFQVLTQSLYPILLYAMGNGDAPIEMKTDWSQFSLSYTCLILLAIVLLMVLPRDTMYIQRVNAFGVVFVYAVQALYDSQTRILESLPLFDLDDGLFLEQLQLHE